LVELAKGSQDLLICQQMGHGVVAGYHQVKLPPVVVIGPAHIGYGKIDCQPPRGCLLPGPHHLGPG
jgi:hypothetical protein